MKRNGGLAFTLIELLLLVVIVVLVVGFLVPGMVRAKSKQQKADCINNLKQIGLSFRMWSPDSSNLYPTARSTNQGGTKEYILEGGTSPHFICLSNELNTASNLICPSDQRTAAVDFQSLANTNLSYFVGVDADDEDHPHSFLSGDRNLLTNGAGLGSGLVAIATNSVLSWVDTMHRKKGSICLGDGSVQWVDDAGLQKLVKEMGPGTNRVAIP